MSLRIADYASSARMGNMSSARIMVCTAAPPCDGTLQSVYRLPAPLCYKLPNGTSLEEGALIEPLVVAIHSLYRTGGGMTGCFGFVSYQHVSLLITTCAEIVVFG